VRRQMRDGPMAPAAPAGVLGRHPYRRRFVHRISVNDYRDQFQIAATRGEAPKARARIREGALAAGLPMPAILDLEVAVGEALSNAILYGSQNGNCPVDICCAGSMRSDSFIVEVVDSGPGFDPAQARTASSYDDIGGRGIGIIGALVDTLRIYHNGAGTVVELTMIGAKHRADS